MSEYQPIAEALARGDYDDQLASLNERITQAAKSGAISDEFRIREGGELNESHEPRLARYQAEDDRIAAAVLATFSRAEVFTVEDGVRELDALARNGKWSRFAVRMLLRRVATYARQVGYIEGRRRQPAEDLRRALGVPGGDWPDLIAQVGGLSGTGWEIGDD